MNALKCNLINNMKLLAISASILAMSTHVSAAVTAADVDQLIDDVIALEETNECRSAVIQVTSGTYNPNALASAKKICNFEGDLLADFDTFKFTKVGTKRFTEKSIGKPIPLSQAIRQCRIHTTYIQLIKEWDKERIKYRVDVFRTIVHLDMISKIAERLLSGNAVVEPVKMTGEEKKNAELFLKATGLFDLVGNPERALQIAQMVRLDYNTGVRGVSISKKFDGSYFANGPARTRKFLKYRRLWTEVKLRPDCPPDDIADKSPPPRKKSVTTYRGVRKPHSHPVILADAAAKSKKPEGNPNPAIQPIYDLGPVLSKIIFEFGLFGNIPANDPTLGQTQKTARDTGIAGSLSAYVPVAGDGIWTISLGAQVFGGKTDNNTLINPAPFPSSPFGGQTRYFGAAALLALERRLGDKMSLRTFLGIGGASVNFEGFQNGLKVVSGTETVPAYRLGATIFRKIGTDGWEIGAGAEFIQLGSFNTSTNTGVPLSQGLAQDIFIGLSLRFRSSPRAPLEPIFIRTPLRR